MLSASCIYPYIFETPPPDTASVMRRYERIPNPFALYAGPTGMRIVGAGDTVAIELTVFGHASRHLAYFIRAFEIAGERGLMARRTPLALVRAERMPPGEGSEPTAIYEWHGTFRLPQPVESAPPPCPERVFLSLSTPLRLKEAGDLVVPDRFAARHLLSSLVRRVSMLMYFHTDEALTADFRRLKAISRDVETFDRDLRWLDLTRKSSRQGTLMQMGGLVGSVGLDLRLAADLWPYLWLGQFIQAGRGTTMGLGQYRIVQTEERDTGGDQP